MTLNWKRSDGFLTADDRKIKCWSEVRNELNGLRPREGRTDVCYSFNADGSQGVPIMPRPFPVGEWKITGFKPHPDKRENFGYLYPVFIATDAVGTVPEWELDDKGFYLRATGRMVEDYFNGLHFSTSYYTQSCLRIATEADVRWLWENCGIGDDLIVED